MAKPRTKVLPARKPAASRDDDSLLTRSAESLGRVIGSLQRQVQDTRKRMSSIAEDAMEALPEMPGTRPRRRTSGAARKETASTRGGTRKTSGGRKTSGARKSSGTRKAAAGGARKSSRGGKTSRGSR